MSSTDTKSSQARPADTGRAKMRRALYRLMWDRVEAGKKTPYPCPTLSDEDISQELYGILSSAGTRRLSERAASFIIVLLFVAIVMPVLALLVRLSVWLTGF